MLKSITCRMTDESDSSGYRFAFYCDICGKSWRSDPIRSEVSPVGECGDMPPYAERNAAYERANLEAMRHFNRCPDCKRWVCDECFRIHREGDFCAECARSK